MNQLQKAVCRSSRSLRHLLAMIVAVTCMCIVWPSHAADAGPAAGSTSLFTSYNHVTGASNISWLTCGHTPDSGGCYGSGQIGPFGHACAVASTGDTVVVVDTSSPGPGSTASTALLVYKQVVSSTPSVSFVRRINLGIPAASSAKCWAGALRNQLYVGTDQSAMYVAVNVATGKVNSGQICGTVTTNIFSNGEYVIVEQGDCVGYFSKDGLQFSGGNFGTTFFPNANVSVPLD